MSFPKYEKYKDSGVEWLGEVPIHWDVVQFKQFVNIQNGLDHKHVEQEEGFPVFGSGGIFTYASDFLYDGESVLLGRKGTIDKPLYFNGRFWTVDTMYWTKIRTNQSGRFVYYSALNIPFSYYSTNTALPSMTKSALETHIIVRPPLDEQINISGFLDRETSKIDELVKEQERLIELLKEKRQAVISHAVTRGLNPNVKLKTSGIEWLGDIPVHWEVKKLKYLCNIQTGARDTEHAVEDGKFPFFVRSQIIEKINSKSFDCEAVLTAGDGAGVGKVFHYHEGPFDFHQRVYMMNNFKEILGRFFFYYFREHFYRVALEGSAKSTVDSLRRPMLTNFPVCLPPKDEQSEIIKILEAAASTFDIMISEAERAIGLLQERRTALISAAVTGKIDVRQLNKN